MWNFPTTSDVTMNGASPFKLAQPYKKMIRSKKQYSKLGQASRARSEGPTIHHQEQNTRAWAKLPTILSFNLLKEVLNRINWVCSWPIGR